MEQSVVVELRRMVDLVIIAEWGQVPPQSYRVFLPSFVGAVRKETGEGILEPISPWEFQSPKQELGEPAERSKAVAEVQ